MNNQSLITIRDKWVWVFIAILGCFLIYIAIVDDTTNGAGDTISHFMFSKYSWQNPKYLLDHWAKPVFTALSSPFSQFGFAGMRVFNALMAIGSGVMIWKIAEELKRPFPPFAILLLFAMPFFGLKIFSGLTEYLYCFLLTSTILLCLKQQYLWACIIASFFPFCRSEGIIAIGMLIIFLIWIRQWKVLPLLLIGHLFYEIIGVTIFDKPVGWTWTKIPYLAGSTYGSGPWDRFFGGLRYVCEWPIIVLIVIGLLYKAVYSLTKIMDADHNFKVDFLLIYGNAVAFFSAHSIFWAYGLFNSAGLIRVMIAIMPLLALIALDSFNLLANSGLSSKWKNGVAVALILFITHHATNTSRSGLAYAKGANNIPEHIVVKEEVYPYLQEHFQSAQTFYNIGYLAILRDENYYGQAIKGTWFRKSDLESMPINSVYVWDSKFGTSVAGIQREDLQKDPRFEERSCFVSDSWNGKYTYCVFEKIRL